MAAVSQPPPPSRTGGGVVAQQVSRRSALALGLLPALGLAGCGVAGADPEPTRTITIGADLSLSGDHQDGGKSVQRALRLQVEQLNNQGAIPHGKLSLSFRDNASDPKRGVANLRAFQRDQQIRAAILGTSDECVTAAVPVTESGDLPVISLAALDLWKAAPPAGSTLFKLAPNPTDDATALVDLLLAHGAHTATAAASPGRYGDQFTAAVRSASDDDRFTVNPSVSVRGDAGQVAGSVLYQGAQPPDAVLIAASTADAGALVGALHDLGFDGIVALDATAASNEYLPDPTLSGAYLVFPPILSMDDQVATTPAKAAQKQWFDDYTSRYGDYAAISGFAADAVRALADAIAAAGTDRGRLRTAVETVEFDGLSGPIRYRPDNHSGMTPQGLTTLRAHRDRWHLGG